MEKVHVKALIAAFLVLIGVLSATFVADQMSSPDFHEKTIQAIDQKTKTVLGLAAASTIASAGISAIPDDTATPIADKLADFAEYFLLVLVVLYSEKYLLTILGAATFRILIPIACVLLAFWIFSDRDGYRKLATKIVILGLTLFLATPLSIHVSDSIYNTYQKSIDATINSAETMAEEAAGLQTDSAAPNASLGQKITGFAYNLLNKASQLVNRFIEALAVLLVTSCVIPVLVLLFCLWLVRTLTGFDLGSPRARFFGKKHRIMAEAAETIHDQMK